MFEKIKSYYIRDKSTFSRETTTFISTQSLLPEKEVSLSHVFSIRYWCFQMLRILYIHIYVLYFDLLVEYLKEIKGSQ